MKRIETICKHLIESVEKNNLEEVKKLTEELKHDVNTIVSYKNKLERDALTEAAHHGNITVINYLINNYGNVNIFYNSGKWNALTEAVAHKNGEVFKLLLSKANLDTKQKVMDYIRNEDYDEKMLDILTTSVGQDLAPLFDFFHEVGFSGANWNAEESQ
jgi:hypothetical protein